MTSSVSIRPAILDDLSSIVEIYNHYIVHTPVTFDLEPVTVEQRRSWFDKFAATGRHRLFVATESEVVVGYAGTLAFHERAAYESTCETTIYCVPEAAGRGIGTALYTALLEAIAEEDIHLLLAGITLPNEASLALHRRFGFEQLGVLEAVGRKFEQYWDVGWYQRRM